MATLEKVLYTAHVTSVGGRDGTSKSNDGKVDIKMGKPVEMGGKGEGLNPEQLFAAGYSACFLGAMKHVAGKTGMTVPDDTSVTAHVSIGTLPVGFGIAVELEVKMPGVEHAKAENLVNEAHKVCPYSNATRGNVDVKLTVL